MSPLSGVIGTGGVIIGGAIFGDIFFLAQEGGDLILQENGFKIIVSGTTGIAFLLLENGDFLLQENGNKIIL